MNFIYLFKKHNSFHFPFYKILKTWDLQYTESYYVKTKQTLIVDANSISLFFQLKKHIFGIYIQKYNIYSLKACTNRSIL